MEAIQSHDSIDQSKTTIGTYKENPAYIGPKRGIFYLSKNRNKEYVDSESVEFDMNTSISIVLYLFHMKSDEIVNNYLKKRINNDLINFETLIKSLVHLKK